MTNDQIKETLEFCEGVHTVYRLNSHCKTCPYEKKYADCFALNRRDVLRLINTLEVENAELKARLEKEEQK